MKEKFFNNIINSTVFTIFIIILLAASLKCFLVSFRIIEEEYLVNIIVKNLHLIYSDVIYKTILALVGLVLFLLALALVWAKQMMGQQQPFVKVATDFGEIKISLFSLEQVILNILHNIDGVKRIKPEIQIQKGGDIKTVLELVIAKDSNIPDIANHIQRKLKEDLPKISGVNLGEVKINVNKIDFQ